MGKSNEKKVTLATAVILLLLLAAYFWYARPVTILELYPMLELNKCTQVQGYYEIGTQPEQSEFTIAQDSTKFNMICDLFYQQKYCRSIKGLLPRGTRMNRTEPDDFQWDVYFVFENVIFPDGSTGSGAMLHFTNWYGDLEIHFNGETYSYRANEQDSWAEQVLDIIQ